MSTTFADYREEAERDAFEAWMATSNYPEIADVALKRLPDGQYVSQLTHAGWQGWLGAILSHPLPAVSGGGGSIRNAIAAMEAARSAIDQLMGDSDLPEDDSPEMDAMQKLDASLAALKREVG